MNSEGPPSLRESSGGNEHPFFTGMQIVDPGIAPVQEWRPISAAEAALPAAIWGGVGRKI